MSKNPEFSNEQYGNMIAQMAERLTTNSEVPSSSPRSGSNEIIFSKLNSYGVMDKVGSLIVFDVVAIGLPRRHG